MSKYRKQMLQLMVAKKAVDAEPVLKAHQSHSAEIESQIDRICEMGEVMRKAVQVDDDQFCKIQEKLAQLEVRLLLFQAHNISESFHRVWKVRIIILSLHVLMFSVCS
uniref:Suppressor of IKBKE 1 n=2 Tax=Rousettus aegyptiacus TaxID=9407 RepID=A0A7J8BHP2_ROUAE|nr:suppressor of IKBKE 1 [Rousettus aegyptiacus]